MVFMLFVISFTITFANMMYEDRKAESNNTRTLVDIEHYNKVQSRMNKELWLKWNNSKKELTEGGLDKKEIEFYDNLFRVTCNVKSKK